MSIIRHITKIPMTIITMAPITILMPTGSVNSTDRYFGFKIWIAPATQNGSPVRIQADSLPSAKTELLY